MGLVGSYFGKGSGKILLIILLFLIGSYIGLHKKLFTSSLLFIFIYVGSLFSKGSGKIYTVIVGFFIGILVSIIILFILINVRKYDC